MKFRYVKEEFKFYFEIFCIDEMKKEIAKNVNGFILFIKFISLDFNVQVLFQYFKLVLELIEKNINEKKINCFLAK